MSPIEKLDEVLTIMSSEKGLTSDADIVKRINKISKHEYDGNEMQKILSRLGKDKYIEFEDREESIKWLPVTDSLTIRYYFITFDGELFIQMGGYAQQLITNANEINRQKNIELAAIANRKTITILTWIIAIGTFMAGLYYSIEILKDYRLFH